MAANQVPASAVTDAGATREEPTGQVEAWRPRQARPVMWWALVGVGWLALLIYEWGRWLAKGDAKPSPTGSSPMPGWMNVSLLTAQVVIIVAAIIAVYFILIRPWRKQEKFLSTGSSCFPVSGWFKTPGSTTPRFSGI